MHQLQYTTSFLPSYFQFTGGTPPGFELSEPAVDYTVSRELNIYVDESGNISTKKTSSLCYMIGLVFHESTNDISKAESRLEEEFTALGYPNTCFHCAPVIYGKDKFQFEGLGTRRRLMKTFFAFFRHLDITTGNSQSRRESDKRRNQKPPRCNDSRIHKNKHLVFHLFLEDNHLL